MSFIAGRSRALVTGAVAGLLAAGAVLGSSALASGGGPSAAQCKAAAAGAAPPASDGDPVPRPFLTAVAQLVHGGTITAAQGRILVADIRTGRVDPEQLVARGTLTRAQMRAVIDRLGAVKRSLAPGAHPATRTK